MLYAAMQKIKERLPKVNLVLDVSSESPYKSRMALGAYQKFSISKLGINMDRTGYFIPDSIKERLTQKWGLVTESDIDVLLDASGFAYGEQWSDTGVMETAANELKRFKDAGKKYIFLPQAFGPFLQTTQTAKFGAAVKHATLVMARDRQSYQYLESLLQGDCDNLVQYPDFTNLLHEVDSSRNILELDQVLIIPNSKMLSKRNRDQQWCETYVEILQNLISIILIKNLRPVVLNHEGLEDETLCRLLMDKVGNRLEFLKVEKVMDICQIIGNSRLVISSRYHGCITALSQGVPCIGTSWSHKYENLFSEYEVPDLLLSPNECRESLLFKIEVALKSELRDRLVHVSNKMKDRTIQMWEAVFAKIAT